MKISGKTIIPLFLMMTLTSCSGLSPAFKTDPTVVMETAIAVARTEMAETQTALPAATPATQLLSPATSLPPAPTPTPVKTSIPISGTPAITPLENGLTWTACIVPSFNYGHNGPGPGMSDTDPDSLFATTCLGFKWPGWDDYGMTLNGQRLREERLPAECGDNLRLAIGKDIYETNYTNAIKNNCHSYDYTLLKNDTVIATVNGVKSIASDPNEKLWNIGGKAVWEIYSGPPDQNLSAIIVDGINLNDKYQLEGSFFVYYLEDKIIFIARKDGKYRVVYNEKFIGPEFDQIFMSHCCASTTVLYGSEQYWFWGTIEGTYYVVAIH